MRTEQERYIVFQNEFSITFVFSFSDPDSLPLKIGLLFGSFNPVHIGHLIIANTMLDQAGLDKVWMVITPQSPFKEKEELIGVDDRLLMVELAIRGNERLKTEDIEFLLPRPNYTCDTLRYLKQKHPENTFTLIIGEDNLVGLDHWKNYEQILEEHVVYVYPRPYTPLSPLKDHPKIVMVNCPLLDISSTFIRESIRKDRSIHYLVPDLVEQYLMAQGLFKK